MNINVSAHRIELESTEVNAGEYNITPCVFTFTEEYEGLVKMAIFSTCDKAVKTTILNNECVIPSEVLENPGQVSLGVYGYEEQEEELVLRYSPQPMSFMVKRGSYRRGDDPELPPQSEWERVLALINEAITETNNLNLVADKKGNITKITITKKDGESYDVEVLDGVSLENIAINNRSLLVTYGGETSNLGQIVPNIQIGSTTTGLPSSQASVVNVGTDLNPILNFTIPKGDAGAIKMQIVVELPLIGQEDIMYLVPIEEPESENNYEEYIWANNKWEKLGGVSVQVDLTDYVKNTDYATDSKAGVFKTGHNIGVNATTGIISSLSASLTSWNSLDNYALVGKGQVKSYVNDLVGDINTALDTINGEVI